MSVMPQQPEEWEIEYLTREEIGLIYATISEPTEIGRRTRIQAIIPASRINECQVNNYVLAWDGIVGKWVALKVIGAQHTESRRFRQHYQHDKTLMESTFKERVSSGVYHFVENRVLIDLAPIVSFAVLSNGCPSFDSASFPLHTEAPVFLPKPDVLDAVLGLPGREDGLPIGLLMEGTRLVTYQVNGMDVGVVYRQKYGSLFLHETVSGTSGSGKTVYLKSKVKPLLDTGFAVITTEREGSEEWSEVGHPASDERMMISADDRRSWKMLGVRPEGISDILRLRLNMDFSIVWSEISPRSIPIYFPQLTRKAKRFFGMAVEEFRAAQVARPQDDNFDNFYRWITGEWGTSWLKKVVANRAMMGNITRSVEDIHSLTYPDRTQTRIFDTPYQPLRPEDIFVPGRLVILKVPADTIIKRIVLMHFMRFLNNWKLLKDDYKEVLTLFIIDEAHDIVRKLRVEDREAPYRDWQAHVNSWVKRMVREARHKFLGFIFSSQFPTDIFGEIHGNCSTKTFFRTCEERVLRSLPDLGLPSEYKERLKNLPNGECYIYGPENISRGVHEIIHRVKVPLPTVMHTPTSSTAVIKKLLTRQVAQKASVA